MTIKPWTERFLDPAPVGVMRQLATLRLMHEEIDELRNALQDSEAGGMTMTQAYKKLRDEAESLREKVWLTAQERDDAIEELAQLKAGAKP